MTLLDDTIETRGFEPVATALAILTIGSCYVMRWSSDDRPLIGIGVFTVRQNNAGWSFNATAKALREGETPTDLLDWLEARFPDDRAIVSWDRRGSVSTRLAGLVEPLRHPQIAAAAADGRWRDLPRSMTWPLQQATAPAMPCLCPPGAMATCVAELPAALMPDPRATEHLLAANAARGWAIWANAFGDFDDDTHPARQALRALSDRQAHDRGLRAPPVR